MNRKMISLTIAMLVITSMIISACGGGAQPPAPAAPVVPATAAPAVAAPATAVPVPATAVPATAAPATAVPAAASTGPITLTIWHNWGPDDAKGPALASIFKDFMAANPDVTIKDEVYVDSDIPLKVETASAANQEPDLVFTGRLGTALNWTDSGISIPVNDLMTKWGFDGKFTDVALSQFTQKDGKIQAFPMEGYTWPIWYNTAVFKAAGVEIPKTTDELIAAVKKIRAAGLEPVVASGSDGMGSYLFYLIIQTEMTDAEAEQAMGKGDWTLPDAIKGVKLFTQLRDAGAFVDGVEGIDYAAGNTRFFTNKVAVSHFGAWEFGDPAAAGVLPTTQLGGFPLPADSPHKLPIYYAAFTAKGIFITPNGAAKMDAVEKFIKFIYQPAMIARFVEQAGMNPPLKDVPVDNSKLNPLFLQSLNMPAEVAETPDLFLPAEIAGNLSPITQEAFTPGVTADKILADLTAAYAGMKK